MSFELETLRKAIADHGRVARVVIVDHKGSSPQEAGASMLVWDGGQSGTIGGGALELEAIRLAFSGPAIRRVPLGPALGQCCGGAVTVVNEVFEAAPKAEDYFMRRIEGHADAPMYVRRAMKSMRNGSESSLVFDDGWLIEPIEPEHACLWVWGAGHVGRSIINVIAPTDMFDVTWVDSGLDRFPATLPSNVTTLPVRHVPDAVVTAPQNARHIVLTYSHAFDFEICHRLLDHGFEAVGVIGSTTKWARFQSRLRALGHSDASVLRIQCPIGDPALGKHPQAIAVGVASELILSLGKRGRHGNLQGGIAV